MALLGCVALFGSDPPVVFGSCDAAADAVVVVDAVGVAPCRLQATTPNTVAPLTLLLTVLSATEVERPFSCTEYYM